MSGVSPLEEQEIALVKFDHMTIPVSNWIASRDWYVNVLGLKVEFEVPDRLTVAVQDQFDFTIFLVEESVPSKSMTCRHLSRISRAKVFRSAIHPRKVYTGYGAELRDPDGYIVRLCGSEVHEG